MAKAKAKGATKPAKQRKPPAKKTIWTSAENESMLQQLCAAKVNGRCSEGGFQSDVWTEVANSFEDVLKVNRVCETKYARLKGMYKDVKFLREALHSWVFDCF